MLFPAFFFADASFAIDARYRNSSDHSPMCRTPQYTVCIHSISGKLAGHAMTNANDLSQGRVIASWLKLLLRDEAAMLWNPGAHHRKLLDGAHALHRADLICRDALADHPRAGRWDTSICSGSASG